MPTEFGHSAQHRLACKRLAGLSSVLVRPASKMVYSSLEAPKLANGWSQFRVEG